MQDSEETTTEQCSTAQCGTHHSSNTEHRRAAQRSDAQNSAAQHTLEQHRAAQRPGTRSPQRRTMEKRSAAHSAAQQASADRGAQRNSAAQHTSEHHRAAQRPGTQSQMRRTTEQRSVGQLPLTGPHNTRVLRFHEVHGHVRKAPLHRQHSWFPWPSALLSGAVCRCSPIALAYLPLSAPVCPFAGLPPSPRGSTRVGGDRGMKHGILSFCIPPGHRYKIIALQKSTQCCLEFTASAVVKCFVGCLVSSAPQGTGWQQTTTWGA